MKVDKIFRFIINVLVCISITNASREIKRAIEKYQIAEDFSNEYTDYQDNIILSLENSREEEEPQVETRFQRKKDIDSYEHLEDSSENENSRSNEIQEENPNSKTTPKSAFMQYVVSNLQENVNVAEDASRMISVIGSLEESIEDSTENLLNGKMVKNETEMFPRNMDITNEIEFNQILSKVNQKLKKLKKVPSENKDESFVNRIEANIAVDESEIKNVQTLKLKRKTKKVINPHLGEKKSYFKYKETLKEKEARKNSLKESISKKSSK